MNNYGTATDTSVLESLDFPVECGHSQHHNSEFVHDDGPAAFVAVSYHDCPREPGHQPPYYYPCCATWAAYVIVNGQMGRHLVCSRCGQYGEWAEYVNIIDTL